MNFAEQVKKAREQLKVSQMVLAKELKVNFSTVNRWENGHNEPHEIVKNVFYSYCHEKGITFDIQNRQNKD